MRSQIKLFSRLFYLINYNIIIVQIRYIIKAFASVIMRKKKHVIRYSWIDAFRKIISYKDIFTYYIKEV